MEPYEKEYKNEIKQVRDSVKEKEEEEFLFGKRIRYWQSLLKRYSNLPDIHVNCEIGRTVHYYYKERGLSKRTQTPKAAVQTKTLSVSERAINYLFGRLKLKGVAGYKTRGKKLDYKTMWVVDFLSSKISTIFEDSVKGGGDLVLYKNSSDFSKALEQYEAGVIPYKNTFVEFIFKASKIREWLGFNSNQMSIKDIVDLFERLEGVIFEIQSEPTFFDKDGKHWAVVREESSSLYRLTKDWYSIISNRWKTQDCVLKVRFSYENLMGWIFIANLSCGRSGRITLPNNARHELTRYEQDILRELRLWKYPRAYPIFELAKIAELKSKEVDKLRKSLIRALENLKKQKYIKDFKVEGKGKNTEFVVIK
jgi:hypothetical protein